MLSIGFSLISVLVAGYAGFRIGQTVPYRLPWSAYLDQILSSGAAALLAGLLAWGQSA